jgi:beta-lactamase regulating signal transducer with metallopeptidase domain
MMLNGFWNENWTVAIVNHLWQSTLVLLMAWLLTLVLKRNQARTRYWVWMGASLKFLVPFSMLAAIGKGLRPASVSSMRSPALPSAMIKMAQPFFPNSQRSESIATAHPLTASVAPSLHALGLPDVILFLWLCGSLFLLLRWSRDWLALRNTLRSASRVSLAIDVPAFLTSHRIGPGIVGFLRPVLLLPEHILDRLPTAQLHSILVHEICHVRRRDNLTAALHMTVEAIFWFHPAVWWIELRLIEERERACDEAVLQLGNEAEIYAQSILNVCKMYTESPIACVSGVTGSELKQRIFRIMSKQVALELGLGRSVLLSVVGILAIAAPVVVGVFHVREAHGQSRPASRTDSIVASWQGTLHSDRDFRFVVKITKDGDGTLRGIFYNIDGAPGGTPVISTTLDGALLKLDFGFATYEGRVSADGNAITGRWSQDSNSLLLNFSRANQASEWTIPQPPPRLPAMAADEDPVFEVATIKPSRPDEHGPRYWFDHRRFSVVHVTLNQLVQFSYGVQEREIARAPVRPNGSIQRRLTYPLSLTVWVSRASSNGNRWSKS